MSSLPKLDEMVARAVMANAILKTYAHKDAEIILRGRRVFVRDYSRTRQWVVRGGQSFYPAYRTSMGGTQTTSIAILIRWIQGRPVFPMSTWEYWASGTINLCNQETLALLVEYGYPKHVECVLCGNEIKGGLDWWCLDNLSGPCCSWTSGCKQKGNRS